MHDTRIQSRAAFTLIELMVSIFLLLLVMIGVNTVFSTTSSTVGAGQAQSAIIRDARAMHSVLSRDFSTIYSDNAPLLIRSEQITRFTNSKAQLGDTDSDPLTVDVDGDGVEGEAAVPGEVLSPANYGAGSHRRDRIAFFTQQSLRRQTGNDGAFMANQGAREGWIWLGHVAQPNNSGTGTFYGPGDNTAALNPNNFYAQQWILGRWATLLVDPTLGIPAAASGIPGTISNGTTNQDYIYRDAAAAVTSLHPLAVGSPATQAGFALESTRFDLAGTSCSGYKTIVTNAIAAGTVDWYTPMMMDARFRCVPFVPRPLTAAGMAQTAAAMAPGCTQFMVEYAGDFLFQDPTTGAVDTSKQPEGQIDFIIDPASNTRSIRWYGLPRDVGSPSASATAGARDNKIQVAYDVVPLRDVAGAAASFEKVFPTPTVATAATDYMQTMPANAVYQCAWSPTETVRPKLVRLVFTLEDQGDRLPGGQTFEYVFALP